MEGHRFLNITVPDNHILISIDAIFILIYQYKQKVSNSEYKEELSLRKKTLKLSINTQVEHYFDNFNIVTISI